MAGRHLRLEEYASSGLAVECEDAGDALSRVKVRPVRAGRGGDQQEAGGAARVAHRAAASHRENDRYMEAFDAAFEELSAAEAARSGRERHEPDEAPLDPREAKTKMTLPAAKRTSSATTDSALGGAWLQGPSAPEGQLHAVSAQPLMCMSLSADESEVVVGSSDHALYVVPLSGGGSSSFSRPSCGASSSSSSSSSSGSCAKMLYTKNSSALGIS
ncbi:F-box/WD repeat-containing protein 7 [Phytophthora cinnamomi]|uniref:F-box/WD repeat-containing protein 7 n=1 Tax=Phytophthora cinnamomi TaxID=4785 RepID=UPI003559ED0A|nr:F-box/WD repeat-containing protein 7 [Phytophthora cinnamomi]